MYGYEQIIRYYSGVKMEYQNVICMFIFMVVEWLLKYFLSHNIFINQRIKQEYGWIGDGYMQKSGFLPIGEANNIVMLFPQVLYYFISINFTSKHSFVDKTRHSSGKSIWMLGLVGVSWYGW